MADGRDGRVLLAGAELKVITGVDDHSRFYVCAQVVVRAAARPVCEALLEALRRHGVLEQILTDFRARSAPSGPWIVRPTA